MPSQPVRSVYQTLPARSTRTPNGRASERGNAISFTEKLLEVSPLEARRLLKQRYQPGFIDPDSRSIVSEIEQLARELDEPHHTGRIHRNVTRTAGAGGRLQLGQLASGVDVDELVG